MSRNTGQRKRSSPPTQIERAQEHATLRTVMRRERAKQQIVTRAEILAWRHDEHTA